MAAVTASTITNPIFLGGSIGNSIPLPPPPPLSGTAPTTTPILQPPVSNRSPMQSPFGAPLPYGISSAYGTDAYARPAPIPSNIISTASQQFLPQPSRTSQSFMPYQSLPITSALGNEPQAGNPHGMSEEEYDVYKEKIGTLQKIEEPPLTEVAQYRPYEIPIAEGVERDLLDNQADAFEQRLQYLEQLAAQTYIGQENQRPQPRRDPSYWQQVRMFDDKFVPMPLGAGRNSTMFTFYKGYYIERDKIAQREAQLKALDAYHQHPSIYWFAGIAKDGIDDDYWDRDVGKFVEKARKEQMATYGAQPAIPIEYQQSLVNQMNQQSQYASMVSMQNYQQNLDRQFLEKKSRSMPNGSSPSYHGNFMLH